MSGFDEGSCMLGTYAKAHKGLNSLSPTSLNLDVMAVVRVRD